MVKGQSLSGQLKCLNAIANPGVTFTGPDNRVAKTSSSHGRPRIRFKLTLVLSDGVKEAAESSPRLREGRAELFTESEMMWAESW